MDVVRLLVLRTFACHLPHVDQFFINPTASAHPVSHDLTMEFVDEQVRSQSELVLPLNQFNQPNSIQ